MPDRAIPGHPGPRTLVRSVPAGAKPGIVGQEGDVVKGRRGLRPAKFGAPASGQPSGRYQKPKFSLKLLSESIWLASPTTNTNKNRVFTDPCGCRLTSATAHTGTISVSETTPANLIPSFMIKTLPAGTRFQTAATLPKISGLADRPNGHERHLSRWKPDALPSIRTNARACKPKRVMGSFVPTTPTSLHPHSPSHQPHPDQRTPRHGGRAHGKGNADLSRYLTQTHLSRPNRACSSPD